MLEQQLVRHLEGLRERHSLPLRVVLPDHREVDLAPQPRVTLKVHDTLAARHLLRPSMASLGEAYVEGRIDVDGPLPEVLSIAESLARDGDRRVGLGALPDWFKRHSRSSDRKAIEYHYDVSDDFYALWLDPQMVYSCAYFAQDDLSLAQAQTAKLEHVCRKLRLSPGQRLLDIGCGWGALVIHAARHHGVQAVGITLSQNQFALATERVREAGLQDRVEIRLQDYRDVPTDSAFDRIASVGMFEHVGLKNLEQYFRILHGLLRPGGIVLNHGITSGDVDSRSVGLGGGEFIDRYVFPDGELPHVSLAIRAMSAAGLELADAESLRRHYARTLWRWSDAFERNLPALSDMAGDRRMRIWRMYLAGCAHAFERDWINLYQLLAVRGVSGAHGVVSDLPWTRDYMYPPDASALPRA